MVTALLGALAMGARQANQAPATTAQAGAPAGAAPMSVGALLEDYQFRTLGPASAGGRIVDVRAEDGDFTHAVVASASGGVWKTDNGGITWTPIFDHYGSSSIGAVAIFQKDPRILWAGTGEANNRNSVAWGDGIYKSEDGGATFQNVGLGDTYQIARVVTHPTDPNTVYVAAIGDLWAYDGRRGVFKTTDGGHNWQLLTNGLPNDGKTGATDLVMDPTNPDILYAAFYQRLRLPWRFDSGGPNGGIFKTTDGGQSWHKLTQGLPAGDTGRIGLDVYRRNPRIVMAIVEASFGYQCEGRGAAADPDCADMTKLGSGVYRSEDGGATWQYLNRYNNRPFYYSQIRINPSDDQRVYVLTTSFRWSRDGGRTFSQAPMPFGPNYDYHAMWIDPTNPDRFYLGGDKGLWFSQDGGATLGFYDNLPVEQFYKVATDMREPYAVYGGLQDNGAIGTTSFSRDVYGIRNDAAWKMHWDDGQYVAVDPTNWRTVYSEGTEGAFRVVDPVGHTDTSRRATPRNIENFQAVTGIDPDSATAAQALRTNWTTPFVLSPQDPHVLYYGTNYLLTTNDQGVSWRMISPDLSKHDPTRNDKGTGGLTPDETGAEGYATIYSISASPVKTGLIWAGTDDGNVWYTPDAGAHWNEVDASIPRVPKNPWVSRVVASAADAETAYVAFDGHRSADRSAYLYRTSDDGRTWTDISAGLHGPVYVICEDDRNPNVLFAGTEYGLWISFDRGANWSPMQNGLPTVAVYDIIIQPRDRDLLLATHGRGLYILDDISALEQFGPSLVDEPTHLFTQRPAVLWVDESRSGQVGDNTWAAPNPPYVRPSILQQRDRDHLVDTPLITMYFGAGASGNATVTITAPDGKMRALDVPVHPGIVRYAWAGGMQTPLARGRGGRSAGGAGEGRGAGAAGGGGGAEAGGGREGAGAGNFGGGGRGAAAPLEPGDYQLRLTLGDSVSTGTLELRPDPLTTGH